MPRPPCPECDGHRKVIVAWHKSVGEGITTSVWGANLLRPIYKPCPVCKKTKPARWLIVYDPATRDFVVLRNEKVIDHVRSYLEGDELRREFEAMQEAHHGTA